MRYLDSNGTWMYCSTAEEKENNSFIKKELSNTIQGRFNSEYNIETSVSRYYNSYGNRKKSNKEEFRIFRKHDPVYICYYTDDPDLVQTVGKHSIIFKDDGLQIEIPETYTEKVKNFDSDQQLNISRMLRLFEANKRKEACVKIITQIKEKIDKIPELKDFNTKNRSLQEMENLILQYNINISNTENDVYPSIEELRKIGWKGTDENLTQTMIRNLYTLYILWNQNKTKLHSKLNKSIKDHIDSITTTNNKFNLKTNGRVCKTISKGDKKGGLINTILEIADTKDFPMKNTNKQYLIDEIMKENTYLIPEDINEMSVEQLNLILVVFRDVKKEKLCEYIYERFGKLGLLKDI
jgi:hypothetical protein